MLDELVLLSIGLNLTVVDWTPAGLWLAVVTSGLYHGVNPGMGWPLAVSAGLVERSSSALVAALWALTVGHLLAMLVVIVPFALLVAVVEWQQQIQIGASLLVIGFGIFRFVNRRHPRVLARIRPTQLALWSFAVAIAHGAGLMLVPIYLKTQCVMVCCVVPAGAVRIAIPLVMVIVFRDIVRSRHVSLKRDEAPDPTAGG